MPVAEREPLTRFLIASNQFAASKLRVKPVAFLPGPDETTSVFRTAGLTQNQAWSLGQRHVAAPRNRQLHAMAEFLAADAHELRLAVVADDRPRRHASLVGWPAAKDARLQLAQLLAVRARLILPGGTAIVAPRPSG